MERTEKMKKAGIDVQVCIAFGQIYSQWAVPPNMEHITEETE